MNLPKLPLVACFALTLSACAGSKRQPPPLAYQPPPPPATATLQCGRTPLPDRDLTSADAEQALRDRDVDLAQCDALRAMLVAGWPR